MFSFNCSSCKAERCSCPGGIHPQALTLKFDGIEKSSLSEFLPFTFSHLLALCGEKQDELHGNSLRLSAWLRVPFLDCVDL